MTKTKRAIDELCDDCNKLDDDEYFEFHSGAEHVEKMKKRAKLLKTLNQSSAPIVELLVRKQKVEQRAEFSDTSQTRIDEFFSPKF